MVTAKNIKDLKNQLSKSRGKAIKVKYKLKYKTLPLKSLK